MTQNETGRVPDGPIEAVVCIPTFRRPESLADTLDSLVRQDTRRAFAVVVVENDAAGRQGAALAGTWLAEGRLRGVCVVEGRQGNVHAINTAFATALDAYPQARFFLMIDDDEIAEADWLERMLDTAEASGAGIVGGPVLPRLAPGSRPALAAHPAFQPGWDASGPVPVIYGSGNCLMTRETFARVGRPPFDVGYNFLGGGDTDFFVRARRAGVRFHWCAEAVITETVPAARTRARWLAARGLRIGAINYRIERKGAAGPGALLRLATKSAALLPVSLLRGMRLLARTREPMIALHPMFVALGRCLAVAGIEPEPYRARAGR